MRRGIWRQVGGQGKGLPLRTWGEGSKNLKQMARDQSRSTGSQLSYCSACLAEKKTERATLATSTHYTTTYLR